MTERPPIPEHTKVNAPLQVERRKRGGEKVYFVLDPASPAWAVLNRHGLSVLEQCDGSRTAEQISAVIKLGLCAVDGSEDTAAQVAANPHPAVAVPLYAAIMRLTWGAPFSQGQPAARG